MRFRTIMVVLSGLWLAAAAGAARAQDREFAVGIGYGHLFWEGDNANELEEQGGVVLSGRLTGGVSPNRPELRVGIALDLAFYTSQDDNGEVEIDDDGNVFATASDYTRLSILQPALEVSWRQPVINEHWYVEPGVAGMLLVGNYTRGQEVFWFIDEDVNRWRVGGAGKAFVRFAYTQDRWAVGAEASYSHGWLDFDDDVGGEIRQGYLGLFYAHRF